MQIDKHFVNNKEVIFKIKNKINSIDKNDVMANFFNYLESQNENDDENTIENKFKEQLNYNTDILYEKILKEHFKQLKEELKKNIEENIISEISNYIPSADNFYEYPKADKMDFTINMIGYNEEIHLNIVKSTMLEVLEITFEEEKKKKINSLQKKIECIENEIKYQNEKLEENKYKLKSLSDE